MPKTPSNNSTASNSTADTSMSVKTDLPVVLPVHSLAEDTAEEDILVVDTVQEVMEEDSEVDLVDEAVMVVVDTAAVEDTVVEDMEGGIIVVDMLMVEDMAPEQEEDNMLLLHLMISLIPHLREVNRLPPSLSRTYDLYILGCLTCSCLGPLATKI